VLARFASPAEKLPDWVHRSLGEGGRADEVLSSSLTPA
jgi:hypothetical protein